MTIQREAYGRDVILRVFGIDTNAWAQRGYRDEIALAFGLERPAFQNQYGELDLFSTTLTIWIAFFLKVDMRSAAGLVRKHWRELLKGLATDERMKPRARYSEGQCFVIACSPDKTNIEAKVGVCEKVFNEMSTDDTVPFPIPLDFVVKQLRKAAEKAGVSLPKLLTPAPPDTPAYAEWIAEIENYRRFAGARRTGRAKKVKVTA